MVITDNKTLNTSNNLFDMCAQTLQVHKNCMNEIFIFDKIFDQRVALMQYAEILFQIIAFLSLKKIAETCFLNI